MNQREMRGLKNYQMNSMNLGAGSLSSCTASPVSSSLSRSSTALPSPPPSPKLLSPHQLTLEEKHHILGVLLKLENLQNMENQRDRLVREEFTKSLDDLAATVTNQVTNSRPTVPVSTPNKYCCHICTTVIGRQKVKKGRGALVCWDCGQLTCDSCGFTKHQTGPFDNRITNKTIRLCKPCMYRREMTLKSGEWFYGAEGAREVRNIHKSVIESLGIPERSSIKNDSEDITNWKRKAQKKIGQSSLITLKAMKRRWQRLANFNKNGSAYNDSKGSENSSDEEMERSRFAEEIQEQYRAFKDSQAAFKLAKKGYCEESSTSSTCSKQWSRESSPERGYSLKHSALQCRSMTSVKLETENVQRKIHHSSESLPVDLQKMNLKSTSLPFRGRGRKNHVSMELAKRMSQKGSVLQKWRTSAGSCSNILFNNVNNDYLKNTPLSSKSLNTPLSCKSLSKYKQ